MLVYALFLGLSWTALTTYCEDGSNITPEQTVFSDAARSNQNKYNCGETDRNGFCLSLSTSVTLGRLSTENQDGPFLLLTKYTAARLLQPNSSQLCWANAGSECCYDPCESNPCFNGKCQTIASDSTFRCQCEKGYVGAWCQVNEPCSQCDSNAVCTEENACECKKGFKGNGTYCTAFCEGLDTTALPKECNDFVSLTFYETWQGLTQYSRETCGGRPAATIECRTHFNAFRFDESTIECTPCTLTLNAMVDQKTVATNTTAEEVEQDLTYLKTLTKKQEKQKKSVHIIAETTRYLEELASVLESDSPDVAPKQISEKAIKDVMNILENIDDELSQPAVPRASKNEIEPEPSESERDKEIRDSTREIPKVVDKFARAVNLSGKTEIEFSNRKMTLTITEPQENNGNFEEVVLSPLSFVETSEQDAETKSPPARKNAVRVVIPAKALAAMHNLLHDADMRLVLVVYNDASHLSIDHTTGQVVQMSFKPGTFSETIDIGEQFTINHFILPQPTRYQYEAVNGTLLEIHVKYFCVFWDVSAEEWSQEGCQLYREPDLHCKCTHFTSFALLLRVTTWLVDYEPDVYTTVACSVSIVCLLATILIYLLIKELRLRRPTPIMINVVANLAIGYLMFVVGMDGRFKNFSDTGCYVSAVLMHFAFLSSWLWMFIYSLNMYYALVRVVGVSPFVSKKIFMYPVGYGVPIIIVGADLIVSLVLDNKEPSYKDDDFKQRYISENVCWVRHFSMYLGFIAPVGVILVINIVLFLVTIRKLTWKREELQSSKEAKSVPQQLFMAITMISMMGLTWIFGYIMLIWDDRTFQKVFSIIFTVFNTCQGLVIFLVTCVRQKSVRVLWTTPIQKFFRCERRGWLSKNNFFVNKTADDTTSTTISTLQRIRRGDTTTTAL